MQNSERQRFEENWKSAFDGAEMTPSDGVWNGLEARLANDETVVMKKRVVFYQRLAAGLTVFALLSGAYAYFNAVNNGSDNLASNNVAKQQPAAVPDSNAAPQEEPQSSPGNDNIAQLETQREPLASLRNSAQVKAESTAQTRTKSTNQSATGNETAGTDTPVVSGNQQELIAVVPNVQQQETVPSDENETLNSTGSTLAVGEIQEPSDSSAIAVAVATPLLSADEINELADRQNELEKKKKLRAERLWVGMGAAAGNFSPGATMGGGQAEMQSSVMNSPEFGFASVDQAPQSNQKSVGSAYSVGMSVGRRIAKRWVLQGGVNLLRQQLEYTSNFTTLSASNVQKSAVEDYVRGSSPTASVASAYAITTPYTVNSNMELISIPLQAGYLIVDKRLGWQLNAGVSQDFFLRNTLTDASGQSERFRQGAGADSPYRTINWAALFSSEFSYRIGDHYRLSVVPGMRYSVRSMLKDSKEEGTPLVMDVGFRFKYLFN